MQKRTRRNDAEGHYKYHCLLTESLEIYFKLNNPWYLGVKKSLRWLENNEPETFRMFESAFWWKIRM